MKSPRNYPLLLASQFLSAFGDNVILAVIIGQLTVHFKSGALNQSELGIKNAVYTTLFFIPYVLGASLAGYLNDRFSKTRWLLGGNLIKLLGTAVCAMSVFWGEDWQKVGYLFVGMGACIYGPAKYGILPEILSRDRLVKANGTVELLTILAILAGPVTGAIMVDRLTAKLPNHQAVLICYSIVVLIYGCSLLLNFLMTPTPFNPEVRLKPSTQEFLRHFRDLLSSPRLSRILLGTGIFWVCGAVMKMNFQPWGLHILQLENNEQIARLGLWLGLGIIGGSVLAGQLHQVGDLRWTRRYGWMLGGSVFVLSLVTRPTAIVVILILIGALAGIFLIPLNAALQAESDPTKLGKTIASQNFVDNVAMMLGGVYVFSGIKVGLDAQAIFAGLAGLIAVAIICLKIPGRTPVEAKA